MDHQRRGGCRHGLDLLLALDERRLAAELALLQPGVGLERELGRPDQPPATLGGVLTDDLFQLRDERGLGLFEVLRVGRRQPEDERVGRPDLRDADAPPRVHLLEDALGELDRLQAAAEGLGEEALDQTTESSFEFAEDRHAVNVCAGRHVLRFPRPILPVGLLRLCCDVPRPSEEPVALIGRELAQTPLADALSDVVREHQDQDREQEAERRRTVDLQVAAERAVQPDERPCGEHRERRSS